MNNKYYNTVYIVGNGLDLCCGIDSSYSNFMESLKDRIPELPYLIQYLYKTHEEKLWTDLESELGNIAHKRFSPTADERIHKLVSDTYEFKNEFFKLQSLLYEYLDHIPKKKNGDNYPLYLMDDYIKSSDGLYILNFNYTPTIENYLKIQKYDCSNCIVNHIHGTLLDNNIIIGVQDSQNLKKAQSFLYKTRHVNPKNVYELNNTLDIARNIIFFGYSLGESDYSYFENLFHQQCKENALHKRFKFYHYGEKGRDDLDYNLRYLTNGRLNMFYAKNEVEFIDSKNIQDMPKMY